MTSARFRPTIAEHAQRVNAPHRIASRAPLRIVRVPFLYARYEGALRSWRENLCSEERLDVSRRTGSFVIRESR